MTAYNSLNLGIKQAGVVWHDCTSCGRVWPFPTGFHAERDWRCHVCVQAMWAKLQRDTAAFAKIIDALACSDATPFHGNDRMTTCDWCKTTFEKPDWRDKSQVFFGHPRNGCVIFLTEELTALRLAIVADYQVGGM